MSSSSTVRLPYRNYTRVRIVFLPIFIEIDAAYERNDKHFITNYCKGKKINPKTLRNKYNRWRDANRPTIHQIGVVDGLSSARGGNNRAFSIEQENELGQYIKDEFIGHHKSHIITRVIRHIENPCILFH